MTQGAVKSPPGKSGGQERTVGLVITGGTIGAHHDAVLSVPSHGESHADLREAEEVGLLLEAWRGAAPIKVEIRCPLRLLSENLKPDDWIPIAEAARDLAEIDDVSGIVVFHGTDTMAYTASALSFLLADLAKPVVLTGSNLPPDQPGSDAARNVDASLVALESLGPGAYIVFAGANDLPGLVHLGTRARKQQAYGHAYASINRSPVGEVVDGAFVSVQGAAPPRAPAAFKCAIDPRVLALRVYPGLNFATAFDAVVHGDIRGVVIELYASVTGPHTDDEYSLPAFIRRCQERGVIVVTTVPSAPDAPGNVYETTLAIADAGGLFLEDMLPETATVKLMWALAQDDDPRAVRELMLTSIAGEIAELDVQ